MLVSGGGGGGWRRQLGGGGGSTVDATGALASAHTAGVL